MKNKGMLRVSDARINVLRQYVYDEFLVDNIDVKYRICEDIYLALGELKTLHKREDEDKHTLLDSDLLQTIDGLQKRIDIAERGHYEVLKENEELEKQNKLLIEDGERLYKYGKIAVNQIICVYDEDKPDEICQPCDNREDLAQALHQHNALKAQIEAEV